VEYDKEKLYFIGGRFNIPVKMIILFMKMKIESTNNRRYELLYTWVQENKITCVQFKMLLKNIGVRTLDEWRLQSGKLLFDNNGNEQYESIRTQREIELMKKLQQKYKNLKENE
jgi:hypothetical protein